MNPVEVLDFIQKQSTCYLIDTLGFEKHMRQIRERRGEPIPPIWYKRPHAYGLRLTPDKIKGPGDTLFFPSFVAKKDYEFEIVAFFTEPLKTIHIQEAIEFVKTKMFFTIFNDLSSRDFQAEDMKLPLWVGPSKGIADKSFGPVWTPGTALCFDENGIPDMKMRLWVNDELRCDSNFRSIYFNDPETGKRKCWGFAQVISWFGRMNQGFQKGDLLGSGTVGDGSIAEFAEKRDTAGNEIEPARYPWLKDGDVIRMEVEGIGVLENRIGVIEMPDPRI
jgi:2-keto-4-pentenoate hydratase/2-oxohepta-3-ene-1,7-dioic acid hydratase in catechol pathway